jgi:hypothetical protein
MYVVRWLVSQPTWSKLGRLVNATFLHLSQTSYLWSGFASFGTEFSVKKLAQALCIHTYLHNMWAYKMSDEVLWVNDWKLGATKMDFSLSPHARPAVCVLSFFLSPSTWQHEGVVKIHWFQVWEAQEVGGVIDQEKNSSTSSPPQPPMRLPWERILENSRSNRFQRVCNTQTVTFFRL